MVDKKISELTAATDIVSAEFAGIQSAVNKRFATSLFDDRFYTKTAADAINTSTISDLAARTRVRTCTTANIIIATALNNADTLNGVVLVTGELVLVKNQSAPAENGIYVVGVSPARSTQFDTYNEHSGSIISVQEGTTGADTLWICTSNTGGTLNTTAIVFTEFGGDGWVTTIKILDANVTTAKIADAAVTNAKLANMADGLLKGRAAGAGTGVPVDLSVAQMQAIIGPLLHPVGCIYFSTNSTNPGTSLGFGTWTAFGAGRVPVGFSSGETEFDLDEEIGGNKTHTLTQTEMPAHTHDITRGAGTTGSGTTELTTALWPSIAVSTVKARTEGGGGAHNNLQPYIVVRMWKRTA